jgi:linearmycin/streptolysin S transport system ATP-binding protein
MDITNALSVNTVSKSFGEHRALNEVSLDVRAGEILGLLGPNGAGKSTLVKAIIGRVRLESGSITILGQPAGEESRGKIGWVPQDLAVYDSFTPAQNLRTFAAYMEIPAGAAREDAVKRGLDWTALADRANDNTKTLSGGMKRRLNMAVGIVHRPRIVLFDEPTVGVDPQSRERIYTMIEGLREDGVTIVYTTHYMEEAERLCDRIAIIDHGRIIALGTREQLVEQTLGKGREIKISFESDLSGPLREQLTARGATVMDHTIKILAEDFTGMIAEMIKLMQQADVNVSDLSVRPPTLESVFLQLTGKELRE